MTPALHSPDRRQLLVLDAGIAQGDLLLTGLPADLPVLRLPAGGDGVRALAAALADWRNLAAIHLVSHGAPGRLRLGTAELSATTLAGYADALRDIGAALADGGDLLLYGCAVADGEAGHAFLDALAAATGADIAATSRPTGNPARHPAADWRLDVHIGRVDTPVAITAAAQAAFPGLLAITKAVSFFGADDGVFGTELWMTDGTAAGTFMVKDINLSGASNPANFVAYNGKTLFSADDGIHGAELWVTDGTAAGTSLVLDIKPGSPTSGLALLTAVNGKVLFRADGGTFGGELWATDGTAAGTTQVLNINSTHSPEFGSQPNSFAVLGSQLLFSAADTNTAYQLWASDGSAGGTTQVKLINASGSAEPHYLTPFNGKVLFSATDGSTYGNELWVTDGTSANTSLLKDINTGPADSGPKNFTVVGTKAFFVANTGSTGSELWVTDGTTGGTSIIKDINGGSVGSYPANMIAFNGKLLFTANDGSHGTELWVSDGTAGGTSEVTEIYAGTGSANPQFLTQLGSQVLFSATDGSHGTELWTTDGTAAHTSMLRDILLPTGGSTPAGLTPFGSQLLFSANDGGNGVEPWITDGTVTGTSLLKNINATASAGSTPANFSAVITVTLPSLVAPTLAVIALPSTSLTSGIPAYVPGQLQVSGSGTTADAYATVAVTDNGSTIATTTADAAGNWSVTLAASQTMTTHNFAATLASGAQTVSSTAFILPIGVSGVDLSGNTTIAAGSDGTLALIGGGAFDLTGKTLTGVTRLSVAGATTLTAAPAQIAGQSLSFSGSLQRLVLAGSSAGAIDLTGIVGGANLAVLDIANTGGSQTVMLGATGPAQIVSNGQVDLTSATAGGTFFGGAQSDQFTGTAASQAFVGSLGGGVIQASGDQARVFANDPDYAYSINNAAPASNAQSITLGGSGSLVVGRRAADAASHAIALAGTDQIALTAAIGNDTVLAAAGAMSVKINNGSGYLVVGGTGSLTVLDQGIGATADTIFGGGQTSTIDLSGLGGGGSPSNGDIIVGGDGALAVTTSRRIGSIIFAGSGSDTITISAQSSLAASAVIDTIIGFQAGSDRLDLSALNIATAAQFAAIPRISYANALGLRLDGNQEIRLVGVTSLDVADVKLGVIS